jgi:hypothetical protein
MKLLTQKSVGVVMSAVTVLMLSTGTGWTEEMPPMPKPSSEHAWLQQFVGEWEADVESYTEPGKPPVKSKGTEVVRPIGGFWILSENDGTMMGQPFKGIMAMGYDANKKKFVGNWMDSMTGTLWQYEGSVDPSGKVLTLESEGMCPMMGKRVRFKDVTELVDQNTKRMTSSMLGEDGTWVTMLTINSQRKH